MNLPKVGNPTHLLLRMSLAFVFAYAAVSAFVDPREWIGYLPAVLADNSSAELLLKIFSVFELGLAICLVVGLYTRYAAILSVLALGGIIISNLHLSAIVFRDIGLLLAALALAASKEDKIQQRTQP